jgi:hypothetical protein
MIVTNNQYDVTVARATTAATCTSANNVAETNVWQFIAVTYDEANGCQIFKGKQDAAVAEVSYSPAPTVGSGATTTDGTTFWIGNQQAGSPTNSFQGQIETVAYYPARLTLAELQDLKENPMAAIDSVNAVGFYRIGYKGTGTQTDLSGNGNSCTTNGTAVSSLGPAHIIQGGPL